jgi:hypothetical protein
MRDLQKHMITSVKVEPSPIEVVNPNKLTSPSHGTRHFFVTGGVPLGVPALGSIETISDVASVVFTGGYWFV